MFLKLSQKKDMERISLIKKKQETICYFSYFSDDINGKGTLALYVDNSLTSYDELQCGRDYKLSFHNGYIDFIVSLKDYNEDLYKELESRLNIN